MSQKLRVRLERIVCSDGTFNSLKIRDQSRLLTKDGSTPTDWVLCPNQKVTLNVEVELKVQQPKKLSRNNIALIFLVADEIQKNVETVNQLSMAEPKTIFVGFGKS